MTYFMNFYKDLFQNMKKTLEAVKKCLFEKLL